MEENKKTWQQLLDEILPDPEQQQKAAEYLAVQVMCETEHLEAVQRWVEDGLAILLRKRNSLPFLPDDYRGSPEPVLQFVFEMCEVRKEVTSETKDLWQYYSVWCGANRIRPLGHHRFRDQMILRGFPVVVKKLPDPSSLRRQHFRGITIKSHLTPSSDGSIPEASNNPPGAAREQAPAPSDSYTSGPR